MLQEDGFILCGRKQKWFSLQNDTYIIKIANAEPKNPVFRYHGIAVLSSNESWLSSFFLSSLKFSEFTTPKLPSHLKQLPHIKDITEFVVVSGFKEDQGQYLKPQMTTFIELSSSCDGIFSQSTVFYCWGGFLGLIVPTSQINLVVC